MKNKNDMMRVNLRFYSTKIQMTADNFIIAPSIDGIITILPYHENMVISLNSGLINIDNLFKYFVYDGILTIENNFIDIVSEFIENITDMTIKKIDDEILRTNELLEKVKDNSLEFFKYKKDLEYYSLCKNFI